MIYQIGWQPLGYRVAVVVSVGELIIPGLREMEGEAGGAAGDVDGATVSEAGAGYPVDHHSVVSVGVYADIVNLATAVLEAPVGYTTGRACRRYAVDGAVWPVVEPLAFNV